MLYAVATTSYLFLTYPSPQHALHALHALDQTAFGKNRLTVNKFGDIERFANMAIEQVDFEQLKGSGKGKEKVRGWVEDEGMEDRVSTRGVYSRRIPARPAYNSGLAAA